MEDILKRVKSVFGNIAFRNKVDKSDKRWIDDDIGDILDGITTFLKKEL